MNYRSILIATAFLLLFTLNSYGQVNVLPLKERASIEDGILKERFDNVLPALMDRTAIDTWVLISREYNEDPVLKTMLPSTWKSARRRTILVLHTNEQKVNGYAIARYDVGELFKRKWNPEDQPNQWESLIDLLQELKPKKIGINTSKEFALADGLPKTEYDLLMQYLPSNLQSKVVSAENLAIGWLETRTEKERILYEHLCGIAHEIIRDGFSRKAITVGVTSTEDLVWWYRQKINEYGLKAWFHPTVDIQRADPENLDHLRSFSKRPDQQIIMPGDLLHVDFGITYLRLNTDTQQHAYVLKPGEKTVPTFLKNAFEQGKRVQDHLMNQFKTGRTGNEILKQALKDSKKEGLKPTIYTHPIGYHGHAAGPTIGLWDQQEGVPGKGDYPLYPNTAYSIELNAAVYLKEWDKEIRIMLEEEAFFTGQEIYFIDGRQEAIYTIQANK